VGSRAQARTALTTPVPVDVFKAEDLQTAGVVGNELGQALALSAPSFNFPRQSNSGTSDSVRAGQLRGLSPDQVLVLVNGRRVHTSAVVNSETKIGRGVAAVDFNTIPLGAAKRIEVLRDGAGAQYGSDAIAGVINIVLDDRPNGFEITGSYGTHVTRVDPIDRTITDGGQYVLTAEAGLPLGRDGFVRFGGEYINRQQTNRAGFDQIPFFVAQTPANLAFQGNRNYRIGDPDSEVYNLWFNSELPTTGGVTFYSFGTVGQRWTEGAAFFRYPDDFNNVPEIFPQGFLPRTTGGNLDFNIAGGARFAVLGFDADLGLTFGKNRFNFGVTNSLNPSLGPASPTEFRSATYENGQLSVNLDLKRELGELALLGRTSLALGAEYRREGFDSEPGDPASFEAGPFDGGIGAQAAAGLTPLDVASLNRDVLAVYVEFSANPTSRLQIDASGRYEWYSDFGSTGSGKGALRYELVPSLLAVRGAVGNTIRAPNLAQIGFSDRSINFGDNRTLVLTRTVPVGDPIAQALGAQELQQERAFSASAGFVFNLAPRLTATVDAFRVRVRDRVTLSERLFGDAIEAVVQGLPGGAGTESVRFFTNAVDTRTFGVDVVVNYAYNLFGGRADLSGGFNYSRTDVTDFQATTPQLETLAPGSALIGVEELNTLETATPRTRLILAQTYQRGPWEGLVRATRFGSAERVFNFGGGFEPSQRYGAEWQIDLELARKFGEHVRLAFGAQNIADNYPDLSSPDINFFGNLPYDILSPIGVNGRFVYARASLVY
jgi:iron complex outermembrane receptor protein